MKERVLIIQSVNDLQTVKTIGFWENHARFRVFYCYAVDMAEYAESNEYRVHFDALLKTLLYSVTSTRPDIIILHTGVAFRAQPESFLRALRVIREQHSTVKMLYEHPDQLSETLFGKSEHSVERAPLENLLVSSAIFDGTCGESWFKWLTSGGASTARDITAGDRP